MTYTFTSKRPGGLFPDSSGAVFAIPTDGRKCYYRIVSVNTGLRPKPGRENGSAEMVMTSELAIMQIPHGGKALMMAHAAKGLSKSAARYAEIKAAYEAHVASSQGDQR